MLVTDLKNGTIFKENDFPFTVVKYEHVKTARGGATVRVKARNLITSQVLEKSWGSNERVEDADVMRKNAQYLYKDSGYVFMDPETFEQFSINADLMGESVKFLKEGEKVIVQYFEGNPISVDLPISLIFEVTYTEPGFKGNTVSNVLKEATLDNGTVIKVPTFIKIGDKVKIDSRTGGYLAKA
ncbi:elongation factor P [candidate division WWE3 bacterium RIFCSPHIGHO2_12_FULL_38_15]|uniref:Elongation factor P n=1 Tax=candidate division WWE3 bacterium RIFCSPHIGHO2_02_FULL_38_14 TaxID=1802620 RepID=A0A1F4V6K5_UNCKA|nr:MAG: elongation factor P [candidate division WWE3 bacterium RIFCSPHIGHO2_01_FULL_38_45]OGC48859.1 MAG: elongation factor P [candidate division WWE3 bacterium RIFCSPHIGHO2_12_FULL_38_15]OGC52815.1 MAG: elongation factor P [candidate division WWE3 bacterium RIFCSPHIGHO2_02_FULL_38_14]OGC53162.1 MAG: elongation factor P [candidate division WWE3 bacterium RIFCSPLOWO2_01_FULL_37_24]HLB52002.1 elongation factor P [Patescibacteria group bacterium]